MLETMSKDHDSGLLSRDEWEALFQSPPPAVEVVCPGVAVVVRYDVDESGYRGTIVTRNDDGTFEVAYEDGDEDEAVDLEMLRVCPPLALLAPGIPVRAPINGKAGGELCRGVLDASNDDGTFSVTFDDGTHVSRILRTLIEVVHLPPNESYEYTVRLSTVDGLGISLGQTESGKTIVTGFQRLKDGRLGPAELSGKIKFKDELVALGGVRTEKITLHELAERIRSAPEMISLRFRRRGSHALKLGGVGQAVEALYGGETEWFLGRLIRVNEDGTLDVRYDDGEVETGLRPHLVRPILPVRTEVFVQYGGISEAFPGIICSVNGDGTYMVRYRDGAEERVPREWIVESDSSNSSVVSNSLSDRNFGDTVSSSSVGNGSFSDIRFALGHSLQGNDTQSLENVSLHSGVSGLGERSLPGFDGIIDDGSGFRIGNFDDTSSSSASVDVTLPRTRSDGDLHSDPAGQCCAFSVSLDASKGLGLKLGYTESGRVIVTGFENVAFVDGKNGEVAVGPAESCGLIRINDILVSVNDESIGKLSFGSVASLIKQSDNIISLRFLRPRASPSSNAAI